MEETFDNLMKLGLCGFGSMSEGLHEKVYSRLGI